MLSRDDGFLFGLFVFGVTVMLMCVGLFLVFGSMLGWTEEVYAGTEYFSSVQEYAEFKDVVVGTGADVVKIDVLSPALPVLVDFMVVCPPGADFPYGSNTHDTVIVGAMLVVVSGIAIVVFLRLVFTHAEGVK
ncbi:MAG: hypothetical protein PHQ43_00760 [Dehalococcoidales bacterium]|nr:hypothetical protein [Dehalococcoidales bacterium]